MIFSDVYYITFTASLERLKREARQNCVILKREALKNLMKNTGILTKTLATILVFVRRWTFAVLTH